MGIFLYIIKFTVATDVDQAITAAAELLVYEFCFTLASQKVM